MHICFVISLLTLTDTLVNIFHILAFHPFTKQFIENNLNTSVILMCTVYFTFLVDNSIIHTEIIHI